MDNEKNKASTLFEALNKSKESSISLLEQLLQEGADINARNNFGYSPLMQVSIIGDIELVHFLLEHNAKVNDATEEGMTPLLYAAHNGLQEIMSVLLSYGAEINAQSTGGATSLVFTVRIGQVEATKLLLEKGADVNYKYFGGKTLLIIAAENGHREIIKLLINKRLSDSCHDSLDLLINQLYLYGAEYDKCDEEDKFDTFYGVIEHHELILRYTNSFLPFLATSDKIMEDLKKAKDIWELRHVPDPAIGEFITTIEHNLIDISNVIDYNSRHVIFETSSVAHYPHLRRILQILRWGPSLSKSRYVQFKRLHGSAYIFFQNYMDIDHFC